MIKRETTDVTTIPKPYITSLLYIFKGELISFIITTLLLFGTTFIFLYTDIDEAYMRPITLLISLISIFVASYYVSKKTQIRGFLIGALTGIIYVLVMLTISALTQVGNNIGFNSMMFLLYSVIVGAIAGIIAKNMKRR